MTAVGGWWEYPLDHQEIEERRVRQRTVVQDWDDSLAGLPEGRSIEKAKETVQSLLVDGAPDAFALEQAYMYGEAFFAVIRYREALIFADAFLDALKEQVHPPFRAAILRTLLWRGVARATSFEVDALSDFQACYSQADDDSLGERPVAARALRWHAQVTADIADTKRDSSPETFKKLMTSAIRTLRDLDRRFTGSGDDPTLLVLARASYMRGHYLALADEWDEAESSFQAALQYSDRLVDCDYLGDDFHKVAAMRSAALSAVQLPPPSSDSGYVLADLRYLDAADQWARSMARNAARAEAHGRRSEPFPAARAQLRSIAKRIWVPFTAKRIVHEAGLQATKEREYLTILTEKARSRHEAACRHIRSCQTLGNPLIILLRNFDFGYRDNLASGDIGTGPPIYTPAGNALDPAILHYYAQLAPVVIVADVNTIHADVDLPDEALLLYLSNEIWEATVRALIRLASLILVVAAFKTPGLDIELQIISEERRSELTVLIAEEVNETQMQVANIVSGSEERTTIPLALNEFEGRVAAAVRSSDPPSQVEQSQLARAAISYVIDARDMQPEDRFLHLADLWGIE